MIFSGLRHGLGTLRPRYNRPGKPPLYHLESFTPTILIPKTHLNLTLTDPNPQATFAPAEP